MITIDYLGRVGNTRALELRGTEEAVEEGAKPVEDILHAFASRRVV